MPITLPTDIRSRAVAAIREYLEEHLDATEPVGDLRAGLLLDYFLVEIGPCIYNRAIGDASAYLVERIGDLEGACFEPEFPGWTDRQAGGT